MMQEEETMAVRAWNSKPTEIWGPGKRRKSSFCPGRSLGHGQDSGQKGLPLTAVHLLEETHSLPWLRAGREHEAHPFLLGRCKAKSGNCSKSFAVAYGLRRGSRDHKGRPIRRRQQEPWEFRSDDKFSHCPHAFLWFKFPITHCSPWERDGKYSLLTSTKI